MPTPFYFSLILLTLTIFDYTLIIREFNEDANTLYMFILDKNHEYKTKYQQTIIFYKAGMKITIFAYNKRWDYCSLMQVD